MGRNRLRSKPLASGFVFFDVFYEDGSRTSNRRVPASALEGENREEAARAVIEAQDAEIADKSGRPRLAIKRLVSSS